MAGERETICFGRGEKRERSSTLSVHLNSPAKKRSSVVWMISCLFRREERNCFASADDGLGWAWVGDGVLIAACGSWMA